MNPGASPTRSPLFWANLAVKAALLALLLLAVVRPDLPQFEGKGMATRVLTYPLAALLVPVAWWPCRPSPRPRPDLPLRGGHPPRPPLPD